jgi:hypothetical protein
LARGLDQKAIHVHDGLPEEGGRLLLPHGQTCVVDDVVQRLQVLACEASAEVARGSGIRDPASTQGIEEDLVVAEQLQVLQAGASTERQIGQGQHMVGLVVGHVKLEQLEASVDGLGEFEASGESVDGTDAADGEAASTLGNLVVDVGGSQDGLGAAAQVSLVEAALEGGG